MFHTDSKFDFQSQSFRSVCICLIETELQVIEGVFQQAGMDDVMSE